MNSLDSIFDKIAKTKRLPILFVGSGISKRYTSNEYSWKELLVKCISLYSEDPLNKYRWYNQKAKKLLDPDSHEHLTYQYIGSMIEEDFNLAYFEGKIKLESEVPDDISPLKAYICELLRGHILKKDASTEIEAFKGLREKMLTVITTNYDTFIEQDIFTEHETIIGQKVFMGSEIGTILKIHGCITKPNSLILTKEDYDKFDKKSKILAAKVLNLFTENPVIFLGYSITDNNVRKLLHDIFTCVDSDLDLRSLTERLIFVRYEKNLSQPEIGFHSLRIDGIDVRMTEITLTDYTPLLKQMSNLKRITELKELHRLRELVHDIVIDYDGDKKKIIRLTPDEEYSGDEVVVAIGKIEAMTEMVGARGLTSDELFKDVVFDDVIKIPNDWIVKETIPNLLKSTHSLPIHKYIKSIDMIKDERTLEAYKREPEDFFNNSIIKVKDKYIEHNFTSLDGIYFDDDIAFTNKMNFLVLRAALHSSAEELEEFLKNYYDGFPKKPLCQTILRKLILIYDKKKYKSTS